MQWASEANPSGSGESKRHHLNIGDDFQFFDAIQYLCSNGTDQVGLDQRTAPASA